MKFVGIVYGPHDSPLYCQEFNKCYEVINGGWTLYKDGGISKPGGTVEDNSNVGEYRIVLEDMEDIGYNTACLLIVEAAKHK
jgi:hypothetical protein